MKDTSELESGMRLNNEISTTNYSDGIALRLDDPTNTQCVMQKQGFMICISHSCQKKNPFVCFSSKCQCQEIHKKCDLKRIDAIQQIVEEKHKHNKKAQQQLLNAFQQINDQVSDYCDGLIGKLKLASDKSSSSSTEKDQQSQFNEALQEKTLTGSLTRKVLDKWTSLSDDSKQEKILNQIKRNIQSFMERELKYLFHSTDEFVFKEDKKEERTIQIQQSLLPFKFTKISAIEPGDEELNFFAKVINVEPFGKKLKVLLGDQTALVRAFFFYHEALKVGNVVLIMSAEARVFQSQIQIQIPRRGKISRSTTVIKTVNSTVNISDKEWEEHTQG